MSKAKDTGIDIFTIQSRIVAAIVDTRDKQVLEEIKKHFKNKYKDEYVNIALLDEQIVDEIIKLGITEYKRRTSNEQSRWNV